MRTHEHTRFGTEILHCVSVLVRIIIITSFLIGVFIVGGFKLSMVVVGDIMTIINIHDSFVLIIGDYHSSSLVFMIAGSSDYLLELVCHCHTGSSACLLKLFRSCHFLTSIPKIGWGCFYRSPSNSFSVVQCCVRVWQGSHQSDNNSNVPSTFWGVFFFLLLHRNISCTSFDLKRLIAWKLDQGVKTKIEKWFPCWQSFFSSENSNSNSETCYGHEIFLTTNFVFFVAVSSCSCSSKGSALRYQSSNE